MTEDEWLTCTEPAAMIPFMKSERKFRLFAVACCRHVWDLIRDERSRKAVETGEAYADGQSDAASLAVALKGAEQALLEVGRAAHRSRRPERQFVRAIPALVCARLPAWPTQSPQVIDALVGAMRQLLGDDLLSLGPLIYDLCGNPFHPLPPDPTCRSPSIVTLAQSIYCGRGFERMPELADTLEKAGCKDDAIIEHCREPGPHVRGCWVVDSLLGKS